jgi:hypothetical protein
MGTKTPEGKGEDMYDAISQRSFQRMKMMGEEI